MKKKKNKKKIATRRNGIFGMTKILSPDLGTHLIHF
jgi:hypothetical protein